MVFSWAGPGSTESPSPFPMRQAEEAAAEVSRQPRPMRRTMPHETHHAPQTVPRPTRPADMPADISGFFCLQSSL